MSMQEQKLWNPYVAGVALGLVVLGSYLLLGHGIGASGFASRVGAAAVNVVAPEHLANNAYMGKYVAGGNSIWDDWLVFEVVGVFFGGLVSAFLAGRHKVAVTKGPTFPSWARLSLAFGGGAIMGFAARMARGCTSGQALSGGSLLSVGSWVFMLMVFAGGYAFALLVRRQWR